MERLPSTALVEEGPPRAGPWTAVVSLINAAVGAGVLSFPWAFHCMGWAAGLVVTITIASVEAWTLFVLARYAEQTRSSNYSELVRKMLGPWVAGAMSLVMFAYIFGSCVAYLIIIGDVFTPLLEGALGAAWYTQRDVVIVAVSTTLVLPLCFPRSMSAIAGVSALTLCGLVLVAGVVVTRSVQLLQADPDPWRDVRAVNTNWHFLYALPIVVFAFQSHTNVIAVFSELEPAPVLFRVRSSPSVDSPQGSAQSFSALARDGFTELPDPQRAKSRRRLRTPKLLGMARVVIVAIAVTCFFYCCMGVVGYLAFPLTARSNILTNFGADDWLIQVARAWVGVIEIASYPIMHNPARAAVRDMLHQLTGVHFAGVGFNVTETLLFFCSTLAVALAVTDLGVVFRLVGGTGGGMLILTLPGLLLMQYTYSKHVQSKQQCLQHQLSEPLLLPAADGVGAAEEAAAGAEAEAGAADGAGSGPAAPPMAAGLAAEGEESSSDGDQTAGLGQGRGLQRRQRQASLDPRHSGLSMPAPPVYSYWTSKLWWTGLMLVALSAALCVLAVCTVLWPVQ